jgi:hypothetical protein
LDKKTNSNSGKREPGKTVLIQKGENHGENVDTQGALGFFKGKKKMVAFADHYSFTASWAFDPVH